NKTKIAEEQVRGAPQEEPGAGGDHGQVRGGTYQVMEEVQKQKELAKADIQKVLKEKDQLTADLNSKEKSFSDLFKCFEKQKEVIEGYRKNEEQ
ncbi:Transforming acidic coiled-coil-containing protein 3, partial [Saguinus oedipus]